MLRLFDKTYYHFIKKICTTFGVFKLIKIRSTHKFAGAQFMSLSNNQKIYIFYDTS